MHDHRLTQLAVNHHGVLLPDELDRAGVTHRQRRLRVASGEWRRLPNGILVVGGAPETFEMRATAALAARPEAVLSHQSAERLHGGDLRGQRVHLAIQRGGPTRAPGCVLHQTTLEASDVVRRHGFRVTTLERTLVDLGATLGANQLQACIEQHLVRRSTTFDRIESVFHRLASPGRTGIARTRTVLARIDGQPPNESELEAMFDRLIERHRIESPVRQANLPWAPAEAGRVDCWYPDHELIVELDGRTFHARLSAFERDRRRDQIAQVNGIETTRFTHRQITDDPSWVVDVLRSVLERRRDRCTK